MATTSEPSFALSKSHDITAGEYLVYTQYNNLRFDLYHHTHEYVPGEGGGTSGVELAADSGLVWVGDPAKLALRTPSGILGGDSANSRSDAIGHSHEIETAAGVTLSASTTNSEGTGNALARASHTHEITKGIAVTLSAVTTNQEGTSSGLARADHTHNIETGTAVTLSASTSNAEGTGSALARADHTHEITKGTPVSLSSTTTNQEGSSVGLARANHTHAITAYSDLATYPSHLAKADASGDSKWHRIDLTDRLRTPLIDSATGQGLTIAPAEDLTLSPGNTKRVKATSGVALQSDNFVSQTTGWRVTYLGEGDFRYLYTDELHAKAFIADLEQALAGGQIIAKSVAVLAQDFTLPAAGGTGNFYVEDLPGAPNMQVFQAGDLVRFRQFTRAAGQLTIADAWGTVSNYVDQADGTQKWTFTRSTGGNAGSATGTVSAKSLVLDYGVSGNGFYEVNAIDGLWAQNSPYAQIATWTTHPASGLVVRARYGNLRGIFNVDNEYGLYAGDGVTDASKFLRISNQAIEGHNLPIKLYDGSSVTVALTPGTNPSVALGNPIPTGWLSQSGFWAGRHTDGTYRQYVGEVSGGALVKGASWDGQSYNVVGNLIVGPGVGFVVDNALLHLPFDGPLPYEQDFHVDLSGHLGQKPSVASGGIIGRPGRFGKAVQLAEATTNLVRNPSFEVDTVDWFGGQGGAGWSISRVTTRAFIGSASLEYHGGTNWTFAETSSSTTLTNGATVTVSVWMYRDAANPLPLRLLIRNGTHGLDLAHVWPTKTGEWERLVTSWTNTTGGDVQVKVKLDTVGDTSGLVAWIDAAQLEIKSYPTPYCDGSLGPGHAWTGTPHASTSTRTATILRYASAGLSGKRGTWAFWVATEHTAPGYWFILDARDGSNADAPLLSFIPGPKIRFYSNQSSRIEAPVTLMAGGYNHCALTYDYEDDKYYLYWNGVLVGQSTDALATPSWAPNVTVGVNYGGDGNWLNGYLDDLLILDRALTADEVRQLYTSGRPVTVTGSPHSLLLTGPGRGKVEGHAGGLFGWDAASQPCWGFCTEDGVSFGGATLNAGDFMIGDPAGGNYLQWDASAGKLTVRGAIVVQPGSSGLANMSDANLDNVADGATYKRTTANEKAGGARGYAGLDASGNVARVIRGAAIAGGSAATGLNLTADYLGYYDGTAFRTYLDKNGNFLFSKPGGASLLWSASAGKLQGRDSSNNVQWETDATTGAIVAGAGKLRLDKDGMTINSTGSEYTLNEAIKFWQTDAIVSEWFLYYAPSPSFELTSTMILHGRSNVHSRQNIITRTKTSSYTATLDLQAGNTVATARILMGSGASTGNRFITLTADNIMTEGGPLRASNGLLVGPSITGAGAGDIYAQGWGKFGGGLNVGTATGAGVGSARLRGTYPEVRLDYNSDRGYAHFAQYAVYAAYTAINLSYDGDWNLDNTSYDGAVVTLSDAFWQLRFASAGTNPRSLTETVRMLANGRVLIGTTSDNGYGQLQVRGGGIWTSVGIGANTGFAPAAGDIAAQANFITYGQKIRFGPEQDGSWQILVSGNNLLVQRRESGSWVTKHTFTP